MYCSGCRVVRPVFGAFCCIGFQGMLPPLRFVASCVFGEIKFYSFKINKVRCEADWSFLFSPFRYYTFSLLNPNENNQLNNIITSDRRLLLKRLNAEVYHIYGEANHVPIRCSNCNLVIIQSFPGCLWQFLLDQARGVKFPEAGCYYEQITIALTQERLDFTVQTINWEDHANQTLSTAYCLNNTTK